MKYSQFILICYSKIQCTLNPVKSRKPNITLKTLVNMSLLNACGGSIITLLCFDACLLLVIYLLQELRVFHITNLIQKPTIQKKKKKKRFRLSLIFREKQKLSK